MGHVPTLFERAAFDDLKDEGVQIEFKERVVRDFFVTIGGLRFDAMDLYESLDEGTSYGHVLDFSREKTALLKRIGVVAYEGNRRMCVSAEKGPNFQEFMEMLRERLREKGAEV